MIDYVSIVSDQREEINRTTTNAQWIDRAQEQLIDLNSSLAQIVIGVRRSGKSTLCMKRLAKSGVHFA